MRRVVATSFGIALLAVLAVAGYLQFYATASGETGIFPVTGIVSDVQLSSEGWDIQAVEPTTDETGVMDQIDAGLRRHVDGIARRAGVPVSVVETGLATFDVSEWPLVDLPADAEFSGIIPFKMEGIAGNLVYYRDPSYVTVEAQGEEITLAVPKDAQSYLVMAEEL